MASQSLNPEFLGQGIRALRGVQPRGVAVEAAVAAVLATGPTQRPLSILVWRLAFAGSAALLFGILLVWPRESVASSLSKVRLAYFAGLRHEITYEVDDKGHKVGGTDFEAWIEGDRYRMINSGGGQQSSSGKSTSINYFPVTERSLPYAEVFHNSGRAMMFGDGTLRQMLSYGDAKDVHVDRGVGWRGRVVDRYNLRGRFIDGQGNQAIYQSYILVDPGSNRPLHSFSKVSVLPTATVTEWDYPTNAEAKLSIDIPKGVPTYDVSRLQHELRKSVMHPLSIQQVGGMEVALRGVCVTRENLMVAIVTGSAGSPQSHSKGLTIIGLTGGVVEHPVVDKEEVHGRTFSMRPLTYRSLPLFGEAVRYPMSVKIPDRFRIKAPIWRTVHNGAHGESWRFLGYAEFQVDHPLRIGSAMTLAPMNLSIFEDTSVRSSDGRMWLRVRDMSRNSARKAG